MNQKQSLQAKYPDLFGQKRETEFEELVAELDLLAGQQPPAHLANLSIAQSLQARQAESLPLHWEETRLGNAIYFRPYVGRRFFFIPRTWRVAIWALAFLLVIGPGLFLLTERPENRVVAITKPVTSYRLCLPHDKLATGPQSVSNGCIVFTVTQAVYDGGIIIVKYNLINTQGEFLQANLVGAKLTDNKGNEYPFINSSTIPQPQGSATLGLQANEIGFDASAIREPIGSKFYLEVAGIGYQTGGNRGQDFVKGPFKFQIENITYLSKLPLPPTVVAPASQPDRVATPPEAPKAP